MTRPVKPPKLPGHLKPVVKRRLRKLWRYAQNVDGQFLLALDVPTYRPSAKRIVRRRG